MFPYARKRMFAFDTSMKSKFYALFVLNIVYYNALKSFTNGDGVIVQQ